MLLVADAETLLFVDDDEPQVAEADLRRENRMRADDDVARARREPLEGSRVRARRLEARAGLDADGRAVETRGEGFEMLLGKHGRGREHRDLLAVHRRDERRTHRDFRLAVAGVAADETVHRLRRGKVLLDRRDCRELVGRLLIGKRRVEGLAPVAVDVIGEARDGLAFCLRLQKCRGEIGDRLLRVLLVLLPPLAVQPVQAHGLALHADVAREEMRVRSRDVQLAAVRILDREDLAATAVHQDLRRANVASDTVVDMDDVLARLQVVEVGKTWAGGEV